MQVRSLYEIIRPTASLDFTQTVPNRICPPNPSCLVILALSTFYTANICEAVGYLKYGSTTYLLATFSPTTVVVSCLLRQIYA